jgi:hypothetical protein
MSSLKQQPLYQPDTADAARSLLHSATTSEVARVPLGAIPTLRVGSATRVSAVFLAVVATLVGATLWAVGRAGAGWAAATPETWWSVWLTLLVLPLIAAQSAGAFTAVAAAENRAAPDERPVPVLPWRRHALVWALAAGLLALVAGLALARDVASSGLLVLSLTLAAAFGVLAATEIGIALGRERQGALVLSAIASTTVWALAFAVGTVTSTPFAAILAFPVSLAVLAGCLRASVRDTRPGIPVWTNRRGELMSLSHRLPGAALLLVVPLSAWAGGTADTLTLSTVTVFVAGTALLGSLAQWTLPVFAGPQGSPRVIAARQRAIGFGAAAAGMATVLTWNLVGFTSTAPAIGIAGVAAALMGWSALCWTFLAARRSRRVHGAWVSVVLALVVVPTASTTIAVAWALLVVGAVSLVLSLLLASTLSERTVTAAPVREALPQLSTDPYSLGLPLWSSEATVDLTVVVPFLRPGRNCLRDNLHRLTTALDSSGLMYEVIAVDDGSNDDSGLAVEDLRDERVRLIAHTRNHGKGGALATGFMHARGSWIGFVDADGDIDASHLRTYLAAAVASDADVVVADKLDERSVNGSSAARQLTSTAMHMVNRRLLRLSTADTQTGAKVYRRELVQEALPRMWENGFAFDVEMFVIADALGFRRLLCMPVSIRRDGGSTVSTRSTIRTAIRVLAIWRRQLLGDYHYGQRTWIPAEYTGPEQQRAMGILPPQRDIPASERRSGADPSHWESERSVAKRPA